MWHWQLLNFKVTKSVWKKYSLTDATIMQLKRSHLINIIYNYNNTDSEKHQYYLVMHIKIGRGFGPPKTCEWIGTAKIRTKKKFLSVGKACIHEEWKPGISITRVQQNQSFIYQLEYSRTTVSVTMYLSSFFPLSNFILILFIHLWKWNSIIKSSWCTSHS